MIELIICNNDNMAEDSISALEQAGYNTGAEGATVIPVFGVDATEAAQELIAAGKMTGTVKQDAEGMAKAVADAVAGSSDIFSVADGFTNKIFVAYAPFTA